MLSVLFCLWGAGSAAVKPAMPVVAATPITLPQKLTSTPTPTPPVAKADAAREIALVNLRALQHSMILDVLSKIVSVANSKILHVFIPRKHSEYHGYACPLVVRGLEKDSARSFAEWEHFAQHVYLLCQDAESKKQGRQDAKQKVVELPHFAKTLTETLRKASVKKEETIMKMTPTSTPTLWPM